MSATATVRSRMRDLPTYTGVAVLWAALTVWAVMTLPAFASRDNLQNIVVSSSVLFVVAIGVTLTVLIGGIDLSVGSMIALVGVVLVILAERMPGALAVVVALGVAMVLAGLVNALLIGSFDINPFVVTLGGLSLFRGLAYLVSDGETKTAESSFVQSFGFGTWLGVPVPVVVMVVLLVATWAVLRFTYFGRNVYAIGGNREAARISGVPITRITWAVYLISGLCAGLGAVLQTGRSGAASPTAASGVELLAAAAVLLGGTRLSGGAGSVVGTVVAVLFLATLENALTLRGVTSYWQLVIVGVLLIAAVTIDKVRSGAER